MKTESSSAWWYRQARFLSFRVNLAWLLRWWLPWLLGISTAFACAVLIAKRAGMPSDSWWVWLVPVLLLPLVYAGWRLRTGRFSVADALVRLESELRLDNALTAAAAGISAWPEPPGRRLNHGLRWRYERIVLPPLAAAALLGVAWRMPTQLPESQISQAALQPTAWQQVDEALAELADNETVTPDSLESFREKLDGLRDQPREEWYSHASLEAGDELRDQLNRDVREFAQTLQLASETVSELGSRSADGAEIAQRDLERLSKAVKQAMQQLGANGLGLDPKLASQLGNLSELDPTKLKSLSAADLQQLREALQNGAGQCQGMGGQVNGPQPGQGDGLGDAPRPGAGGITRGPGAAPMSFGNESERAADRAEGASSQDFSRASLGGEVGQSTGSHEVDVTVRVGPQQAGGIVNGGAGGETVLQNNLTPGERQVLKEFFK